MKEVVIVIAVVASVIASLFGFSNLNYVKYRAEARWLDIGYEVVGYEGWQGGPGIPFTSYGGARVWYQLRKIPDNGISYTGYLVRWGDEIHVYGPTAIDAIKP